MLQGREKSISRQAASRRLSATILFANKNPMLLGFDGLAPREYMGALIAPNVLRNSFESYQSNHTIIDIDIGHPSYLKLLPRIIADGVSELSATEVSLLQDAVAPRFLSMLDCQEATRLRDRCVSILCKPSKSGVISCDSRIYKIIELVEKLPFSQFSLRTAAAEIHLSESRTRHLFKAELKCTLSEYARWANVQKVGHLWQPGSSLIAAVTEAGFYDLAHFNRAVKGFMLILPSALAGDKNLRVTRCNDIQNSLSVQIQSCPS